MENKEGEDKKIKEDEMIYRMSITSEAGEVLERLANEVNQGFVGGKISRQDVASWAIGKFAKVVSAMDIKELRLSVMSDQALLRYCIEKTSAEGQMAPDLRQLLLIQCGLVEQPKKFSDKKARDKSEPESVREAA